MKGLQPVADDPIAVYDAITARKRVNGPTLGAIRPIIQDCYQAYSAARSSLETLQARAFDSEQRSALLDSYEGTTKPLAELKQRIRAQQPELIAWVCQYCGFGESWTFDHYVPKAAFPEFAVHPLNLLPACWTCNHARSQWTLDKERTTINLYFDSIDESEVLLGATVTVAGEVPSVLFRLEEGTGAQTNFGRLYSRHVDALGLLERFRNKSRTTIDSIRDDLVARKQPLVPAEIRGELDAKAERKRQTYGLHHWKVALYRAAAASDEFIELCCRQQAKGIGKS